MDIIKIENLSKTFSDFWKKPKARAVNNISFSVQQGEIIGLLGPNGSGKSTTIKMILNLLYPTSGSIQIFGKKNCDISIKYNIGYLPEETYLYNFLTAKETLDLFGSLFKIPKRIRRKRIEELLGMVGLANSSKRQIGEFSKGMARRIGLAQSLINNPDLLILDEPTSGLDPIGCKDIKNLITFFKQQGKTILICSHLLSDIEEICDRVIILYGGKIRAEGKINELLTISKQQQITIPTSNQVIFNKFIKILKSELSDDKFIITNPKISLEDFFINVINRAKYDKEEIYGAESGGQIANYLKHNK
ncbi:MAG TPA: ABC transporter ATP-binding protein [Victivallales bacterium]|nr:ABC transporter ATP-binding protein [Victivallales bacterium]